MFILSCYHSPLLVEKNLNSLFVLFRLYLFRLNTRFKWKGLAISAGGLLAVSFVVTAVIIDHYDIDVLLLSNIGG